MSTDGHRCARARRPWHGWGLLCAYWVAAVSTTAVAAAPLDPAEVQKRIERHRTAQVTLTVLGADGRPLANAEVVVRQVRHRFLFGSNAFGIAPREEEAQKLYRERFAGLLNYATLPFYWGAYERQEGQVGAARVRTMAEWCRDNGIATKGHPLVWHQGAPRWLEGRSPQEMARLQLARVGREVTEHKALIRRWDVVNEAAVMPRYQGEATPLPAMARELGTVELIKRSFAAAKAADPDAVLLLNDYDTSPAYEKLIDDCLKAGVPIDVIGIQSHMHQGYWGAAKAWEVCERFARLGKPIHFTELTILSGPRKPNQRWHGERYADWHSTPEHEAEQAKHVAEFYTVLFSHPAVEAITWWDFSDRGAWLGAPSGLIRADMTPKPAYDELMRRVKGDWWTKEIRLTTDAAGRATFRGFLGGYELEGPGGCTGFVVEKPGESAATARIAGTR